MLGIAVVGYVLAAGNQFPDARSYEPIVAKAWQVAAMEGKEIAKLEAYRWIGSAWEEIPFQIDEREPGHNISADSMHTARQCVLNSGQTPPPNCSDVYLPAWTQVGLPTGDGVFDGIDELVVMAHDLGNRASDADGLPSDDTDFETTRAEVRARDPISGGYGWFYVFAHTTTSFTKSATAYVTYGDFPTGSEPDPCAGPRTPNQACGTVSASPGGDLQSPYYKMTWAGNWSITDLDIQQAGVDLIDRLKGRAVPLGGTTETELLWDWGLCPIFRGYTAGPVRMVRPIQGAQSGVTIVKNEIAYGRFVDIEIEFRAHEIKSFKQYFDYDPAATPIGNRLELDLSV